MFKNRFDSGYLVMSFELEVSCVEKSSVAQLLTGAKREETKDGVGFDVCLCRICSHVDSCRQRDKFFRQLDSTNSLRCAGQIQGTKLHMPRGELLLTPETHHSFIGR